MFRFALLVMVVAAIGSHAAVRAQVPRSPWSRIVNGTDAEVGEYPSQLSLRYLDRHNCGASILSANWALTAAHCVWGYLMPELSVLAGTMTLESGGSVHQLAQVILHPQYEAQDSWRNDIAVIKVSTPFTLDSSRQPVKLPAQGQSTAIYSVATVIGWGYMEGESLPNNLQKADVMVTDPAYCKSVYNGLGYNIYPSQICAEYPETNIGSCSGDDGGPLFVNGEVVGIVSWAVGCAAIGYPTVYTQVSSYRTWIYEQTEL